jgi:pimeloyl-ACP methyl ester carboxylesterase
MPRATANGIELEYETVGSEDGRPLLLIMGLGGQLIHWPEGFCSLLAERGHFLILFDNRDSGLSTSIDGAEVDLGAVLSSAFTGQETPAPYLLDDMADDAAGLLDALGLRSAHIVGASMGGMIAQAFAIRHPARVRSLTSIMSTPEFVEPDPELLVMLATPPPPGREAYIERSVADQRLLAGASFPPDEEELRRVEAVAYDRGLNAPGTERQLAAILGSPGRRTALAGVRAPTLVIHGSADRLVPPIGGRLTAEATPGAELLIIDGMGHDLPRDAWPTMVDAISQLTERAEAHAPAMP